jgi:hypothetical protein
MAKLRTYAVSAGIGIAIVTLLSLGSDVATLEWLGYFLAPGLLLAAIVFPQGAEGDWPYSYLVAALLIDVILYAAIVWVIWTMVSRSRLRLDDSP